jgi:hypothetical protein
MNTNWKWAVMGVALASMVGNGAVLAQQNSPASQIQTGTQPGSPSSSDLGSSSNIKSIPELYPGESSDFGTQRIVQEKIHRKWVELNLDWQAGYNDNYLLTTILGSGISAGKPETTQMTSTWDVAFAPDAIPSGDFKLFPRIGFRQSFFNYGLGTGQTSNFSTFDFDTQTVYGENKWDFGNDWTATIGADATRITSSYSNSEIYRQFGPRWGVSKLFKLNETNLVVLGLDQQYLVTETPSGTIPFISTDIYDRLNTTFSASYIWSPMDKLFLTPYYRMVYAYYPHYGVPDAAFAAQDPEDRSDFTNTVGLITSYQVNDYITARVFVSYEKRVTTYSNPNDPLSTNVPEYGNFNAGLGGSFSIRF